MEPKEYRQLKLINKRITKSRMIRGELPTPADVIERQRKAIKERLLKTLNHNTYADY